MRKASGDTLEMLIFPAEQMEKYNEFKQQYGNLSERQIYREIARLKNEVSQEVLDKHIKNLDAISNMEGFITEDQKGKIEQVKSFIGYQNTSRTKGSQNSRVETEFVSGTSLLLWFLILVAIW
ncbi:MAG: hypothetical protein K0R93_2354 [Anaerosolibacter sp.]|jgi:hypothetical protein|uniref:hypothetical protein n=1 Tax=Anaerosolibacter sp. TaxID=1872527 RepID=UPI00260BBF98|nr:hypothetical protein [Anaerosolibacter sp.]MDF2547456.1 hypothetical protein [Anaerosolibacter sp.]